MKRLIEKIVEKYMYFHFWVGIKFSHERGKDLILSASLASAGIIDCILIVLFSISFPNEITRWANFYRANFHNKVISFAVMGIWGFIIVPFFYKYYKRHYKEFYRRATRKKKKHKGERYVQKK